MVRIYGIKNCDTMKKAFAWCEANHVSYEFHDYKKQGVPRDALVAWCRALGWQSLVNSKGPTWRKLPPERQAKVLPYIRDWVTSAATLSAAEVFAGFSQMGTIRDVTIAATLPYDFVLSPVSPVPAFKAEWASPIDDPQHRQAAGEVEHLEAVLALTPTRRANFLTPSDSSLPTKIRAELRCPASGALRYFASRPGFIRSPNKLRSIKLGERLEALLSIKSTIAISAIRLCSRYPRRRTSAPPSVFLA